MQPNKLFISDELMQILEKMKSASVIANKLIELSQDIKSHPINSDHPNYLGQSAEVVSNISYFTVERLATLKDTLSDFEQGVWTSKKRFRARPAALVQKILSDCNGRDVEIFSNVFKSVTSLASFKFSIVKGEDIRSWYHYSKAADNSGSLGASCMKHDFCQEYLDIYCKNADQISLLLMLDNRDRVMGRALLWEDESVKIMDRIYTINDEELTYHFKMWANQNGYSHKTYQRWNMPLHLVKNGKEGVYRIKIKLKHWDFPKFPYVDTFKFLDTRSGVISNYNTEDTEIILMHSEGKFMPQDYLFEDFLDNCFYHKSEAATIEYLPGAPKKTRTENCIWSNTLEQHILRKDSTYDEVLDDYILNDNFSQFIDREKMINNFVSASINDFNTFTRFMCRKNSSTLRNLLNSIDEMKTRWRTDKAWVEEAVRSLMSSKEKVQSNDESNTSEEVSLDSLGDS